MPARHKNYRAFRDLAEKMGFNLRRAVFWDGIRQYAAASQTQSLIGACRNTFFPRLSKAPIPV